MLIAAPFAQASDLALEAHLLARTNEARAAAGLVPLEPSSTLTRIARAHAAEMAELSYFSHTSPRPENATLARRAANAGSFARDLGENLALVGRGDPARASVEGWLGSPSHRANLLSPEFTRVGFGTARYPDGRTVVAQEFALEPAELESTSLTLDSVSSPQLDVRLELSDRAEIAVFFAGTSNAPVTLGAGPQLLHIPLSHAPALPLALKLGVRPPGSSDSFGLQASGTLAPEGWAGIDEAGAPTRLLEVSLNVVRRESYTVRLVFSETPRLELTAWQNGARIPTEATGTTLSLRLQDSAQPLHLGLAQRGGRYRVVYSFRPRLGAAPRLFPVAD